jgi:hypothetical protein
MLIKAPAGQKIEDAPNASVVMESGDHLSVGYTDPSGKFHVFNISAQHLVFMAYHEGTESAMLIRPNTGLQFVPGQRVK